VGDGEVGQRQRKHEITEQRGQTEERRWQTSERWASQVARQKEAGGEDLYERAASRLSMHLETTKIISTERTRPSTHMKTD
jgi:hypothetical protein